jgi:hypothetical protein
MKRKSVLESAHAMLKRNSLCGITMLILFMVISGCAGPWKGKIIDVETKEPLEGAVVLAVWQRVYRTPTGSSSYFYEAKETVTNKAGEFEIPSYTPFNMLPIISYMSGPEFTIFKPGHGSLHGLALGGYFTGEKQGIQDFELQGRKYRFALGLVELPPLRTWDERSKASMISPYGDIPTTKWPLLNELRDKEEEWLRSNKGWGGK